MVMEIGIYMFVPVVIILYTLAFMPQNLAWFEELRPTLHLLAFLLPLVAVVMMAATLLVTILAELFQTVNPAKARTCH